MTKIILIKRIKILDANALSSPYTIGFPAMTAWLGAVHALQKQINKYEEYKNIIFSATGVVCHNMQLRVHKVGFNNSIIGTRNPLNEKGENAAIIQEAKCHLEVSLVIEYQNISFTGEKEQIFIEKIKNLILGKIRFAGGSVINSGEHNSLTVERYSLEDTDYKKIVSKLGLCYALIERRDLIEEEMKKGSDALDSILKYAKPEKGREGWIIPIAVGFQAISDLSPAGTVKNQRDPAVPHRFAESIVTLGEFKMPRRFNKLSKIMWRYHFDEQNGLYLCHNQPISN